MGENPESTGSHELPGATTLVGQTDVAALEAELTVPELVGRFEVGDRVGAGSMGVVYRAYDPRLDRPVALKFLLGDVDSVARRERLSKEARALARVSHPNVIQVYDVGAVGSHVYLAMEFIDGVSLRDWLSAAPRTVEEIRSIFAAAGRGLAAAHEAGLVHRDFKPDNVMVTSDGRVVVLDFGIANAGASIRDDITDLDHPDKDTDTTPVGTPLYMAPELIALRRGDARADQFGFCVSLWEAVYGVHPFAPVDSTVMVLAAAILVGEVLPPPNPKRVSPSFERALRRGLRTDPEQRFESVSALLDALEAVNPGAKRQRRIAAGVVLCTGAVLALAAVPADDGGCEEGLTRLEGVWDDGRREALSEAFEGPGMKETHARVEAILDDYAASWVLVHDDACEAMERDNQESFFDARMLCLDRRRASLQARVDVLSETTADTLGSAIETAASLPSLDPCSDLDRLRDPVAPVRSHERAVAMRVQALVERASAARIAGQYGKASSLGREAVEATAGLGHAPTRALAQLELARALDEAGDYALAEEHATSAYHDALSSRDDAHAFEAAVFLLHNIGAEQRRFKEGREWGDIAASLLESRASKDAVMLARARGSVSWRSQRTDEALALFEHALQLGRDVGVGAREQAETQLHLGAAYHSAGREDDAKETLEEALETLQNAFGPNHPSVATALNNLGAVAAGRRDHETAIRIFKRVTQIRTDTLGPDHQDLAETLNNLATLYHRTEAYARALDTYRMVLRIYGRSLADNDPVWATTRTNMGWTLLELEQFEAAQEAFEQAIEVWERNDLDTVPGLAGLGHVLLARGEVDQGLATLRRAVVVRETNREAGHPLVAQALAQLGRAYVDHGRPQEALPILLRAQTIRAAGLPATHPDHGETLSLLARTYADMQRNTEGLEMADAFEVLSLEAQGPARVRNRVAFDAARLLYARHPEQSLDRVLALQRSLDADDELRVDVAAWLTEHQH